MRHFVVGLAALLAGCAATTQCLTTSFPTYENDDQLFHNRCGSPHHWETFPIHVRTELSSGYEGQAHEAVRIWNGLVGREFLSWEPQTFTSTANPERHEDGVIRIIETDLGENIDTDLRMLGAANTHVGVRGDIEGSVIRLDYDVTNDVLLSVLLHEIGHALGLAHDPTDPASTMHPLTWEPRIQRLTSRDVSAIRVRVPETLPTAPQVPLAPSLLSPFSPFSQVVLVPVLTPIPNGCN